ncbi:hypothetical protein BXZ70DRAFT_931881 [Cristinia sonorae]|uniref:Sugar phosphate transporter domain-containing protein n=1 Tax=Cristinia sonorae TaxID=1940300 RepID=A0A8K0XQZ2_9AGAR|nr:hypothetical protein BXZ70DRAFT_931881 [Cristinia sonorae]
MSPSNGGNPPPSRGLVTATVLFYLVAALAMVIANKWVLNQTVVPLFFLFSQLVVAVILFLMAHAMGLLQLPMEIDLQVCKGLIPMVGLNVVGLSFSNYTLSYVDASFYPVARGMVLPFTVVASFFFLNARPSFLVLVTCAIVTVGFFIGVFLDAIPVSLTGIAFGVSSSLITAVHSVVIKKSLDVVKGSALHLSWYTNLLSSIVLIPIMVLAGEVPDIVDLLFGDNPAPSHGISLFTAFILGSIVTGGIGFLMSIASLLSIKVTSPITHMVSSAVRGVAGSLLGKWIFKDIITTGRATSIAVILGGSVAYTWVKHNESQRPAPKFTSKSHYERVPLEEAEAGRAGKPE